MLIGAGGARPRTEATPSSHPGGTHRGRGHVPQLGHRDARGRVHDGGEHHAVVVVVGQLVGVLLQLALLLPPAEYQEDLLEVVGAEEGEQARGGLLGEEAALPQQTDAVRLPALLDVVGGDDHGHLLRLGDLDQVLPDPAVESGGVG